MADLDFVRLFTDGACSGNPGPGGWAYILQHPASGKVSDGSGAEPNTTNNRMELMAAIEGLAALKKPCRVELVTDSTYVGKGLRDWMPGWKAKGWKRGSGRDAKPAGQPRPVAEDRRPGRSPRDHGLHRPGSQRPPRERSLRPHGGSRIQGPGPGRPHGIVSRLFE